MSSRSLAYVSFDRFPAPKGAAVHIEAFVSGLATQFENVDLVTVASTLSPSTGLVLQRGNHSFRHTELPASGSSLVERVLCFRTHLRAWWGRQRAAGCRLAAIPQKRLYDRQSRRVELSERMENLEELASISARVWQSPCRVTRNSPKFDNGAGVLFVLGLIYGALSSKYDLQNRRYQLLQTVISLLSRDMPKDARFDVTLDLAPPNEKRKKAHSSQIGAWKVTHYHDPWLKLRGRLVDGTKFDIVMAERFQARKKWKRSSSGKNKLKTKTKSATVASVSLAPKQKNYQRLADLAPQVSEFVSLPYWVNVKKVSATPERLSIVTSTTEDWSIRRHDPTSQFDGSEMVVTMLLSLFQVLHESRRAAPGR